ncbi:MAG: DUF2183 domain-containing protein [Bacteroidia bacterium]|nr:DUF2183 domain-containing protein [Bacteroidia bacterium]
MKTSEKLFIACYNCRANDEKAYIQGRVLEDRGIKKSSKEDSVWENFVRVYKRMGSREVPFALVEVTIAGQSVRVHTDEEGFFSLEFPLEKPLDPDHGPHKYQVTLVDSPVTFKEVPEFSGQIFIPPKDADFGVISDVDDTIMYTGATSITKMVWVTMTNNSLTRVAFKGVSRFYRALVKGPRDKGPNPFFYVSSGPWNLFYLIYDFIELNKIPMGPVQLRDFGRDDAKNSASSHGSHKKRIIEDIFSTYPWLNFILIGDTGQYDAFIYYDLAKAHPDRILAVYLRDARDKDQNKRVQPVIDLANSEGIHMLKVKNSLEAAQHAVKMGFMEEKRLAKIEKEMTRQRNADQRFDDAWDDQDDD